MPNNTTKPKLKPARMITKEKVQEVKDKMADISSTVVSSQTVSAHPAESSEHRSRMLMSLFLSVSQILSLLMCRRVCLLRVSSLTKSSQRLTCMTSVSSWKRRSTMHLIREKKRSARHVKRTDVSRKNQV